MLKYVVFPIICLFLTVGSAFSKTNVQVFERNDRKEIDSIKCDNEDTGILEVGNSYNFDVSFSSNDGKVKVDTVRFWFWADEDYNGNDGMVQFSQTDKIKNLDGIVGQEAIKLIESTSYVIKKQPKESSTENVLVKYEILFNKILPDGSLSKEQESYVQCGRYTVMKPKGNK